MYRLKSLPCKSDIDKMHYLCYRNPVVILPQNFVWRIAMSELLLVWHNNGIKAVMTKTQHNLVYGHNITDEELYRRRNASSIVVFAPRSRIRDWYQQQDTRFLGVSGTVEDLDAILKRHCWNEHSVYVPFSNGPNCERELLHHAASWETFRSVFGPNDWTFKFGRQPDWLMGQDDFQDHLLERTEHAMAHGAHLR